MSQSGDSINWARLESELRQPQHDIVVEVAESGYVVPVRAMDIIDPHDHRFVEGIVNFVIRRDIPCGDGHTMRYFGQLDSNEPRDTLLMAYNSSSVQLHMLRDHPEEPDAASDFWIKVEYDIFGHVANFIGYRANMPEETRLDALYSALFEEYQENRIDTLVQFMKEVG